MGQVSLDSLPVVQAEVAVEDHDLTDLTDELTVARCGVIAEGRLLKNVGLLVIGAYAGTGLGIQGPATGTVVAADHDPGSLSHDEYAHRGLAENQGTDVKGVPGREPHGRHIPEDITGNRRLGSGNRLDRILFRKGLVHPDRNTLVVKPVVADSIPIGIGSVQPKDEPVHGVFGESGITGGKGLDGRSPSRPAEVLGIAR